MTIACAGAVRGIVVFAGLARGRRVAVVFESGEAGGGEEGWVVVGEEIVNISGMVDSSSGRICNEGEEWSEGGTTHVC